MQDTQNNLFLLKGVMCLSVFYKELKDILDHHSGF